VKEAIPSSVGTLTKEIVTDEKQPEKSETEGHKMQVDTDIIHSDSVNKSEKGTPESLDKQEAVAGLEDIHISDGNRSSEIGKFAMSCLTYLTNNWFRSQN
jgi:hypothetical protein